MTIVFASDVSLSLRGFSLWYKAGKFHYPFYPPSIHQISEPTDEYHRQNASLFSIFSGIIVIMLLAIFVTIMALVWLLKTDKVNPRVSLSTIRFVNPNSNNRQ